MKKILLACLSTAMCAGLSAQTLTRIAELPIAPSASEEDVRFQAPTDNGYDLKFCGNFKNFYTFTSGSGYTYYNSIYITPEIATALAGNQVTELTLATAFLGTLEEHPGSIYVAEERFGEPVAETECTISNCYDSADQSVTLATLSFDQPYTIKEGVGFYVGYSVDDVGDNDYPVSYGTSVVNPFAGYIDVYAGDDYLGAVDMADTNTNLFLAVTTVGEKKEMLDVAVMEKLMVASTSSSYTFPTVVPDTELKYNVTIYNCGDNVISAWEFDVENGEGEPAVFATTGKVNPLAKKTNIKVQVIAKEGQNPVSVRLTKAGDRVISSSETFSTSYFGVAADVEGYPRNIVVEEGTGTWCGWCPRGIVGMDYMEATYPEDFVGIAVHSGDKFEADSYAPVLNKYFSGFPSAIFNRDLNYTVDPAKATLESNYKNWKKERTFAKVELTGDKLEDNSAVIVNAKTTFMFGDNDANYRLAFVVLENGLKGVQTNYYAGGSSGAMDGWENKGSSVAWTYTNTARDIYKAFGLENSIPVAVAAETPNEYTYTVPMDNVADIAQTKIVAMLLEGYTGVVLNAAVVEAADYGISGLSSTLAEQACNVRGLKGEIAIDGNYSIARAYNLAGQQVGLAGLAAGIYVVNVDGNSYKVAVK